MNPNDRTHLLDMLDAARKIQAFIQAKERTDLEKDDFLLGFAVVRAIEIVGEAANHISPQFRQTQPQVAWKNIIGMRNRIVHDYLRVDYDIVWQVATKNIPELIPQLEQILVENQISSP